MKKLFLLLIAGVFISGCSSTANLQTDDEQVKFEKTDAKNIKVYSTANVGTEYTIIGQVVADVDAGENATKAVNKMKVEAAQLGADAVINFRLEIDTGYWQNAIKAYGTAVKLK
ncbi:MAG: heavy metal-binding domain-containing protein [Ignavibacteriales bacterium]|nr:heavy metal-binding domain-containing protein [Ignavibacteriales bacterium]